MKKVLIAVLTVVVVFGLACVSFASVGGGYEVAVARMQGDVKVDVRGDGSWITPWQGMKLKKDALIRTGVGSYCDIVFDAEGLNLVRIKSKTEITVERAQVFMPDGEVLVKFANLPAGSTFTVKTPSAACGIRGSGMGVKYDQATGQTEVAAFESNAFVQPLDPATGQPTGSESTLPQGSMVGVSGDGQMGDSQDIPAGEMDGFNDFVADAGTPADTDEPQDPDEADADAVQAAVEEIDADVDIDVKDLDEQKEISPSS